MSIFSNLLDNAIESCLLNKDKDNYIKLKTMVVGNYFTVKVVNSKVPEAKVNKKTLQTRKKDRHLHGYGLKIINEIVLRYNGNSDFTDNQDNFSAMVMLMME